MTLMWAQRGRAEPRRECTILSARQWSPWTGWASWEQKQWWQDPSLRSSKLAPVQKPRVSGSVKGNLPLWHHGSASGDRGHGQSPRLPPTLEPWGGREGAAGVLTFPRLRFRILLFPPWCTPWASALVHLGFLLWGPLGLCTWAWWLCLWLSWGPGCLLPVFISQMS